MSDGAYLALQVGAICLLLFAVAVTLIVQHPELFGAGCVPC